MALTINEARGTSKRIFYLASLFCATYIPVINPVERVLRCIDVCRVASFSCDNDSTSKIGVDECDTKFVR